ncbi:unnamed protein product [Lepeophtheirus salmonis]|uniref:(salmon louse) hypothetical protein n=1 Tax=Lepeophtheirus salmonis TaxID=72036 RepID=A0A7R8H8Y7_LEPSM|nr:unnamed protein product [Lepeophtheirus salmonis]CAF2939601.1 unnamed protein product [Lepeophtheirus salmonis]
MNKIIINDHIRRRTLEDLFAKIVTETYSYAYNLTDFCYQLNEKSRVDICNLERYNELKELNKINLFKMKSHTSHTDQRGSTVLTPIANVWQNVRDTSETSNSYSKQKQIFATLFASLGCFLNGTSIGYTGVAIPSLMNGTFDVYGFPADYSQQQVSWITSLMYVGCILGGLFSRFFMDFMGRRRTLLYIVNTFYLSGHILIFFGSCAEMFYIGRILNGIALGLELCDILYNLWVHWEFSTHLLWEACSLIGMDLLLQVGYEFQAVQSLEWLRGRDDAAVLD